MTQSIDIIIPLYNKGPYIQRAIASVQAQTVTTWRLIIVDDGSTDNGPDIVRQHQLHDPRIQLITQANQGPGPARNAGLNLVKTPIVAFLDADDEWLPHYLQNVLQAFADHPDIPIIGSMYERSPENRDMTDYWHQCGVTPGIHRLTVDTPAEQVIQYMIFLLPWNTAYRTDTVRRFAGFQACDFGREIHHEFGEDVTLTLRLLLNEPFIILPQPAARYHAECSEIGIAHRANPLEVFLNRPQVVQDYCPDSMLPLLQRVINRVAMFRARNWAYYGYRRPARKLLQRYPQARQNRDYYRSYFYFCYVRPRWWTRFKCWLGPRLRRWLSR